MKVYMWHYILDKTNNYHYFPLIDFEKFIKKESKQHHILSLEEFKYNLEHNINNANDILLTFDDGTIDHYTNVFPILKSYEVQGLFFISNNISKQQMLLVHIIHVLLSKINFEDLYKKFRELIGYVNYESYILNNQSIYETDNDIIFFKIFLQTNIKNGLSIKVLQQLTQYFNIEILPQKYYISINHIKEMVDSGMVFGNHTQNHYKLGTLDKDEQINEILNCDKFIANECSKINFKSFSYPYGSYNDLTIKTLQSLNYSCAFTVENKEFTTKHNKFLIPRLDCNVLR